MHGATASRTSQAQKATRLFAAQKSCTESQHGPTSASEAAAQKRTGIHGIVLVFSVRCPQQIRLTSAEDSGPYSLVDIHSTSIKQGVTESEIAIRRDVDSIRLSRYTVSVCRSAHAT